MLEKIKSIGPLRLIHAAVILVLVVSAPFAGGVPAHSGWSMWPSLLAPAIAPMFFFVMGLDILMAAVYRSSAEGKERQRFGWVLKVDIFLLLLLFVAWWPFFSSLVSAG
ncbi:MAG: cell division protein FtsW (lipid II flippase) [Parasphingorhabdus sp.]|jgi:cell division protein FtsW (lipid II flippase)